MFIPPSLRMPSIATAQDVIDEFGFGVLVSPDLVATHVPCHLERDEGEFGTLYAHLARANPHWRSLADAEALVIFNGPHGYVSPTWYAAGPGVPTWNYVAVHARGRVSLLDEAETLAVMRRQVMALEPELLERRDILTTELEARLAGAVVGLRITLSGLEGKHKLGQQRSPEDQRGVHMALARSPDAASRELAVYMQRLGVGTGD